ncbi:Transcription initiation factor TFIID subunit 12 [Halotydeus destructor]|nr:Transcription initiation factor TFIID subunit 12 [Halotydeus destructor]
MSETSVNTINDHLTDQVPISNALNTDQKPPIVVLNKQRLQELVAEIDPNEQLDEEVEDVLLQMTEDFIDKLVASSCLVAKHRQSNQLEVKDVQLVLEKNHNMNIPGFGAPLAVLNRLKSHSSTSEAHRQRMALIKKTIKKF